MISNTETLHNEITRAESIHRRFGLAGLAGGKLAELLQKYRESIEMTEALMFHAGAADACARCAQGERGSCCFREMGESYGLELLYSNLLLGCALPARPDLPESCHFVGERGCKLKAKHSFCLNYFCPDLRKTLGDDMIERIQRQVGEQLLAGWELERALTAWLGSVERLD